MQSESILHNSTTQHHFLTFRGGDKRHLRKKTRKLSSTKESSPFYNMARLETQIQQKGSNQSHGRAQTPNATGTIWEINPTQTGRPMSDINIEAFCHRLKCFRECFRPTSEKINEKIHRKLFVEQIQIIHSNNWAKCFAAGKQNKETKQNQKGSLMIPLLNSLKWYFVLLGWKDKNSRIHCIAAQRCTV